MIGRGMTTLGFLCLAGLSIVTVQDSYCFGNVVILACADSEHNTWWTVTRYLTGIAKPSEFCRGLLNRNLQGKKMARMSSFQSSMLVASATNIEESMGLNYPSRARGTFHSLHTHETMSRWCLDHRKSSLRRIFSRGSYRLHML